MADQKIVGNAFVTGSYTVETQYVFCRDCRVQLEPLLTWDAFKLQRKQDMIAKLPPKERSLLEARKQVKQIEADIAGNWFLTGFLYVLGLIFTVLTDGFFAVITVAFLALWTGWFLYWRKGKLEKLAGYKEQAESAKKTKP